jgi:hypothetical protein
VGAAFSWSQGPQAPKSMLHFRHLDGLDLPLAFTQPTNQLSSQVASNHPSSQWQPSNN